MKTDASMRRLAAARPTLEDSEARAILGPILSSPRPPGPSTDQQLPLRPHHRRRRGVLAGVAASVAVVACVVVVLARSSTSPLAGPQALKPHDVVEVRARLVSALDSAGGDILEIVRQPSGLVALSPGQTRVAACSAKTWIYPSDPTPGDRFNDATESVCPNGARAANALELSTESVVPGNPARPPSALGLGEFVCGVGSETGFQTSDGSRWHASSKRFRIEVPATPALLRDEVDKGILRAVGNTTVDGKTAIELTLRGSEKIGPSARVSYALWIDAANYLPIRQVEHLVQSPPGGSPQEVTLSQDLAFLSPTKVNLKLLNPPVPSGLAREAVRRLRGALLLSGMPKRSDKIRRGRARRPRAPVAGSPPAMTFPRKCRAE